MEQKFKRGNKVKVLVGALYWKFTEQGTVTWTDIASDQIGKEAVIIGSYSDLYSGFASEARHNHIYEIIFCETGNTVAWKKEIDLEFIETGGEHLIAQAVNIRHSRK